MRFGSLLRDLCMLTCVVKVLSFELSLPKDYDKSKVPRPAKGMPVEVYTRWQIQTITNIDVKNQLISIDAYVYLEWEDPRINITVHDEEDGPYINIHEYEQCKVWMPHMLVESMRDLTIRTNGFRKIFRLAITKDKHVLLLLGITVRSPCEFDFGNYPFDVQCCIIKTVLYPERVEDIVLKWAPSKPVVFQTSRTHYEDTPEYVMKLSHDKEPVLVTRKNLQMSGLVMRLEIRRQATSYILQFYLPTGLFVIISWGSFLVSPEIVPGRIALLVTNILTLVTIFEATTTLAPPSLNIRASDVWVLSCIVFVFLALLQYGVVLVTEKSKETIADDVSKFTNNKLLLVDDNVDNNVKNRKRSLKQLRIVRACLKCLRKKKWNIYDRAAIFVFPALFVVFNVCYWCFYLSHKIQSTVGCE